MLERYLTSNEFATSTIHVSCTNAFLRETFYFLQQTSAGVTKTTYLVKGYF